MKKLVLVAIAALFMSTMVSAQLFQYGLKAGVNFGSLPMEEIQSIPGSGDLAGQTYNLVTGESVTGYQAGLMTRVNVAMFFVQPELYFNVSGATVEQVASGGATEMLDVQFQRFDIPVLVGVKLGPLRVKAGPVGTAVINTTGELYDVVASDLQTISDGLTWGFQAGASVDLMKKLALEVRYEGSLSKYADSFDVSGQTFNFDARPKQWIMSVGWWF